LGICVSIFALSANAQDKRTWRKYDLQSIEIPPPNVVYNNAHVRNGATKMFGQHYALEKLVLRETKGTKTTIYNDHRKSLSVHSTPDIHQRIAENIAHLQRPETKNVRFVMEIDYLALGDIHESSANNPEIVLWKENRYGLLKIGTGVWKLPPGKFREGIESPIQPYLRPIPIQKTNTTHYNVDFFWVAKDDIPKMQEAWHSHIHNLKRDSRFRGHFRSQPVIMSSGQLGINMENVSFPFTLSEKKWYKSSPTIENFSAIQDFTSVSVISNDGRTVSSDIDIRFPQFPKLSHLSKLPQVSAIAVTTNEKTNDYLSISEENLTWSAEGILVVFMSGIPVTVDAKIVKEQSGVPLLMQKQVYTLSEYEAQTLTGILTIRMVTPNEMIPTAIIPAAIR